MSRVSEINPDAHDSADQNSTKRNVRVLFSCTGVGIENRGIESFFREAFNGLRGVDGIEARLLKGAGTATDDEVVARVLSRRGSLASILGRLTRRNSYVAEQWSSFPSAIAEIRRFRPEVIFYSDSNLGFLLRRFRRQIGVPYRLLFSNGGPCHPPFNRHDYVHQVAPLYRDEAIAVGEPESKHFLIPYGIHVPPWTEQTDQQKQELRTRLRLPVDRPIVLSVGWIAQSHKRMDYVVDEVSRLPEPRPFLQLLGAMDEQSEPIIRLAREKLGEGNFSAKSVPYDQVGDFYRAADVFALGSLAEGFGRVYLEALMHGLPTIGHKHPVIEYVLGDAGVVADLSSTGGASSAISKLLNNLDFYQDGALQRERWAHVRRKFHWGELSPNYQAMFRTVAASPIPGKYQLR